MQAARELMVKKLEQSNTQKIVRYFPDTHLGNAHYGLSEIAAKEGVDIAKLKVGEYVIFVNSKKTALKMFSTGNMIAHLRMPGNTKIDMNIISSIPRFFNGKSIDYKGALKERIEKSLGANVKVQIS